MTTTTAPNLQRLGATDVARLREMNAMFARAFDEAEEYSGAPPSDAWLQKLLANEGFMAIAALNGGRVIGGLVAYELTKFEQERREVYVYDLAVAEEHRRQGIATALLLELKRIAKARGAWVVFIQADATDEGAIAVYSRLGTREDAAHFDLRID